MTNDELNEKIRQACTHAAPDVLDAVLSDCNEQKGRVILMTTENKKKTWAVRMAGLAAGLCRGTVFQLVKCCGYVGKRSAACIFEVKRHILVIVLHARPLGGGVGLILVIMCARFIFDFNAFTNKLFAGKQVNRCQVVIIDSIIPAKGVDFFLPSPDSPPKAKN